MIKHIYLILFIFLSITITAISPAITRGEHGITEILQLLILGSGLILTINNRKIIIRAFNYYSYILKIIIFIFLIYEENSYLTIYKSAFFNNHNAQSEINFHNSNLFNMVILENIKVPFLNYTFSLTLSFVFFTLIFALLGFGSYIKKLNSFRFLFFERRLSLYCLLYLFDTIIGSIIRNFTSSEVGLIEQELIELFFYSIFLIDIFDKLNNVKKKIVTKN